METAANIVKCELAGEVLRSCGTLRLRVNGASMMPSVWPGDTLRIQREDFEAIATGDVVLFQREGRLVAHRVIATAGEFENCEWTTQGDGMPTADAPVTASEMLGKVDLIERGGRCLEPRAVVTFRERLIANLVRRSDWAARILARGHALRRGARRRDALCPTRLSGGS
ncbi:MAG: S24/S26 family peptidase [Candidatus Acidiferrales bacterium]